MQAGRTMRTGQVFVSRAVHRVESLSRLFNRCRILDDPLMKRIQRCA